MPTLMKFLVVVVLLAGAVFAGLWSLANLAVPPPREITVTIPQDKLGR
jgi:hypothetical protein